MKHIQEFSSFLNEQETRLAPNKENPIDGFADLLRSAKDIFTSAGFLPEDPENGIGWGGRLGNNQSKVPTEEEVKKGVAAVNAAMDRHKITDKKMRASIQGVIGKECGWVPRSETPYNNTPNDRIRKVFGKRVDSLNDAELNSLKANANKFWDRVYGPNDPTGTSQKNGNTNPGDGAKYLGRGFNGVTFKSGYEKIQKLYDEYNKLGKSINFVSNPNSLNDIDVAAEVAVIYFLDGIKNPKVKSMYGSNDPNKFSNKDTALKAVFHTNAGLGKDINKSFFRDTLAKAADFRDDMLSKNMV